MTTRVETAENACKQFNRGWKKKAHHGLCRMILFKQTKIWVVRKQLVEFFALDFNLPRVNTRQISTRVKLSCKHSPTLKSNGLGSVGSEMGTYFAVAVSSPLYGSTYRTVQDLWHVGSSSSWDMEAGQRQFKQLPQCTFTYLYSGR